MILTSASKSSSVHHTLQRCKWLAKGSLVGRVLRSRHSPLLALPEELVLEITDWLEISDETNLSLCNRSLYRIIGTGPWDSMRSGRDKDSAYYLQRQIFLTNLAKDHPRLHFCHRCRTLHSTARVVLPGRKRTKNDLSCTEDPTSNWKEWNQIYWAESKYNLRFQHVQLVMERHRYGRPYGITLDALSETQFRTSSDFRALILMSVCARVVSDELCLRAQNWTMIRGPNTSTLCDFDITHVCLHLSWFIWERHWGLDRLPRTFIQSATTQSGGNDCTTRSPLRRCQICAVEFQLEIKHFGPYSALVCTKWLNLGRGETPMDAKWKRHGPSSDTQLRPRDPTVEVPHQGSLRSAFESVKGQSVAAATAHNQKLLLSRRRRRNFKKGYVEEMQYETNSAPTYKPLARWVDEKVVRQRFWRK